MTATQIRALMFAGVAFLIATVAFLIAQGWQQALPFAVIGLGLVVVASQTKPKEG